MFAGGTWRWALHLDAVTLGDRVGEVSTLLCSAWKVKDPSYSTLPHTGAQVVLLCQLFWKEGRENCSIHTKRALHGEKNSFSFPKKGIRRRCEWILSLKGTTKALCLTRIEGIGREGEVAHHCTMEEIRSCAESGGDHRWPNVRSIQKQHSLYV